MARHYRAFLLRCWQLGDGGQRFDVAHIQSGATLRATTLADALGWIAAQRTAGYVPGEARRAADAPGDETTKLDGDGART